MRQDAKAAAVGSIEREQSGRGGLRRAVAAVGAALALGLLLGAGNAAAAPWGFEQVTPVDKGAGTVAYVDTFRTAQDGNSFLYTTGAPFDSIPSESSPAYTRYIGHRGPDQWHNISLDLPFETGPGSGAALHIMSIAGSSRNLRYVVGGSPIALTPGATEGGGNIYLRDTRTRELTLIATSPDKALSGGFHNPQGGLYIKYVDGEGKAVLFASNVPLVDGAPPSAGYKWTPEGGIEAVTVLPESEGGGISVGSIGGYNVEDATRLGIPDSGGTEHIYWTKFSGNGVEGSYVRTGGETKPISHSRLPGESTQALPALVDGVSRNGEYAVFHTGEGTPPLTADTPELPVGNWYPTTFLYRYKFSDGSLDYVGTSHLYGTAGVIQMTQDGQSIAFQGEIAQAAGAENEKPNMYIWRDGELELVATLEKESAAASTGGARSLFSANGRYFNFTANAKGLAEKFDQDDSSSACALYGQTGPQPCDAVYVYDTEATGDPLQCASCRAPGVPPLGPAGDTLNNNTGFMRMDAHMSQSIANDGTVYFTTRDGLVPTDGNNLEDVYAYRDGDLRLVSRGAGNVSARFLEATEDGKTVFISTDDPIYPGDNDRAVDIYMTREGAGYPYTTPPVPPACSGIESCHRGVPPTPTQSSPGSSGFEGRGNEGRGRKAGTGKVTVASPRPAVGPSGTLKVKAPGKGKLTVTGAGVKKATKSVAKAGTYSLKVTLTPAARKALAKSRQVKKKLKVSFKPAQGKASSTTVALTYKASANTKGGR